MSIYILYFGNSIARASIIGYKHLKMFVLRFGIQLDIVLLILIIRIMMQQFKSHSKTRKVFFTVVEFNRGSIMRAKAKYKYIMKINNKII